MNKYMKFKVTFMDNCHRDNTRSRTMTWDGLMKRIKNPPVHKWKDSDAIIAGECTWKDGIAEKCIERWDYVYDGDGEIVIEDGKKKRECTREWETMYDWRGNPIKRPVKGTLKIVNRSILFLDCDDIKEPAVWLDNLYTLCEWWNWAFAIYSTFTATKEKPKYRVVIPLDKPVTPDEYQRIVRSIMHDLKEENFDPCSPLATQIMYLPAWPCPKNPETGEWENGYYENIIEDDGEPINTDSYLKYLDAFDDMYKDFKVIVRKKKKETDEKEEKQYRPKKDDLDLYPEGDPRNKNNIIGDFCRAYSISEAIDEFDLPYDFVSTEYIKHPNGENEEIEERLRYIYRYSQSHMPGAFIKNDDTLFYTYHSTDPAYDPPFVKVERDENGKVKKDKYGDAILTEQYDNEHKNNKAEKGKPGPDLNAWDLVMIHKCDGNYIEMCKLAREKLNKPHD